MRHSLVPRARYTDLGLARDRQLDDASRVNPTCVDLGAHERIIAEKRQERAAEPWAPARARAQTCASLRKMDARLAGTLGSCTPVDPPGFAAIFRPPAPVAELVDAPDSKSGNGNIVLVRVRPGAPLRRSPPFAFVR